MSLISTLFSFQGRLNRRPLWGFLLFVNVVNLAAIIFSYEYARHTPSTTELATSYIEKLNREYYWFNLFNVAALWPALALATKRAHDLDRSGWYVALLLVPMVNFWIAIGFGGFAGTPGTNRFGPDPLASTKPGLGWLFLIGHMIVYGCASYIAPDFVMPIESRARWIEFPPNSQNPTIHDDAQTPYPSNI